MSTAKRNTVVLVFLEILSIFIISTFLIKILADSVCSFLANIEAPDLFVFIFEDVFYFVISLLVVWLFCRFFDKIKLSELGFKINGHWSDIFRGFCIPMALLLAGTGIIVLTNHAEIHFFRIKFEYLTASFAMLVFSALTEETLYRGYIINRLITVCNKNLAVLLSALIFSGVHLLNPNFSLVAFVNIFLAGVLLGLLYIRKMNLWLPVSFHLFWNFIQSLLGYPISGGEMPSIFILEYSQANLINGGEFGFEASLICSALLLTSIIVISLIKAVLKK